jgi:hypothetical protein
MGEFVDYVILYGSAVDLRTQVVARLGEGWVFLGTPYVMPGNHFHFQAMVKLAPKDNTPR